MVTSSDDATVQIWDLRSSRPRTLSGHDSAERCVSQVGVDKIVSGAADGNVLVHDLLTGELLWNFRGQDQQHTGSVTSVHADETHVVSGSLDGTVKVLSAKI